MYLDIPHLKRCCFCFPLRLGLLTLGYINLLYTLTVVGYGSYEYHVHYNRLVHGVPLVIRGSVFRVGAELILAVYCLDAVLFGVLLVGAHKKNVLLMRIFYVYGITTTLVSLVLNLCLIRRVYIEEIMLLFLGIILESYLLLMVRSEIVKLEQDNTIHYVNVLSDVIVDACPMSIGNNNETNADTNSSQERLNDKVYLHTVS